MSDPEPNDKERFALESFESHHRSRCPKQRSLFRSNKTVEFVRGYEPCGIGASFYTRCTICSQQFNVADVDTW
jgi:hypothetical protein